MTEATFSIPVGGTYRRLDHGGGKVRLVNASITAQAPGHQKVVLAPKLVGVCRSDLRELLDERYQRRDFGHEIVAEVVARSHHALPAPGQWVVYDPHPRVTRTSGFAERVEVEGTLENVNGALVPVSPAMNQVEAVFAEPLACASHCVRRLEEVSDATSVDSGSPVAVVGAGMAGALIAAAIYATNVPAVLLNRGQPRLEFLRSRSFLPLGTFAQTYDGAPRMFERVILATAMVDNHLLQRATELVTPGGILLLYSGTRPSDLFRGESLDSLRRLEGLREIRSGGARFLLAGTHGATRVDFERALDVLSAGHIEGERFGDVVARLVTSSLSLEEAGTALPTQATSGFIGKCVVRV